MIAQFELAHGEPLASTLERRRSEALKAACRSGAAALADTSLGKYKFAEENGSVVLRSSLMQGDLGAREEFIRVGAILANAYLAMESQGVDCELSLMPGGGVDGVVARLTPTVLAPLTDLETSMLEGLSAGATSIAARSGAPSVQLVGMLRRAARDSGAWVDVIMDDARKTLVADVVASAVHFSSAEKCARDIAAYYGSDIPVGSPPRESLAATLAVLGCTTDCDATGSELRARRALMGSTLLLVLGTERDTVADWMRAGIALQRVMLLTAGAGFSASVHPEIADHPQWRAALDALVFARGKPQVVLHFAPVTSAAA